MKNSKVIRRGEKKNNYEEMQCTRKRKRKQKEKEEEERRVDEVREKRRERRKGA